LVTIQIVETKDLKALLPDGVGVTPTPLPKPLIDDSKVCTLLVDLAVGQSVGPCQMSATVLYYVIERQGHLRVEDEQAELQTGSLAIVPAGAVRAISAAGQMRILAVQIP
jgi:quercetin dioxygenase-like cupin family protein